MKTKEELETLKKEYESLQNKLKELSSEELNVVSGGEINVDIFNNWEILPTIDANK